MGELLLLLLVIGAAWLMLKIFGLLFHFTFAVLALPFKLFALAGALVVGTILIVPLALVAGFVGLLLAPVLLIIPLLPFILIGWGIVLLLKN